MLYRKIITDITYEDVLNFCNERIKENEFLDYKGDFPRNLEKTISSMANTYGGIIIIGINDDDGSPKPPFEGIEYETGLQERVTQIDISNIFPPVFPEVQVCSPVNNKTFIVIRVAESNSTPHYIMEKTKAYIRTGNLSSPESIADFNKIEWLRDKRKKSEDLRENLFNRAEYHFQNVCGIRGIKSVPFSEFTISICPMFPSKSLIPVQEIENIVIRINSKSRITYNELKHYKIHPIENGIVVFLIQDDYDILEYLEANQFGLISKKGNLVWKANDKEVVKDRNIKDRKISFEEIFLKLLSFLEFSIFFYNQIGYKGLCKIKFVIKNTLNLALSPYIRGTGLLSWHGVSIIEEISLSPEFEVISIPKIIDKNYRLNFLIDVTKNIAWSFGSEFDPSINVDKILIEYANRYIN